MKVEVWDRVVRPALVDRIGWAIFIGTPKGYNHFYDLYNLKHPDYKSFHFTSYNNPTIKKEEIDQERALKSDDAFATEYLAEFRVFIGKIYKDFSKDIHVKDSYEPPMDWARYRSIDFGVGHPTAVLFFAIDNEHNIWIYDEIYIEGANTPTVAQLIREKSGPHRYIATYADRSGKAWILEYSSVHGIPMLAYSKEPGDSNDLEVTRGIDRVQSYLKVQPGTGKPKLFVTKNCVNLIREFEMYEWSGEAGSVRKPVKKLDDLLDALRYFIVSYQQRTRPDRQVVKAYSTTGQPIY